METSREVLFLNQFDATCWNEIINEYSIRMHYKSKSLVRRLVGTREACCACYDPFTPSAVLICVSSRYTARRFRNGEHELYKQCGSEICFQPSSSELRKKDRRCCDGTYLILWRKGTMACKSATCSHIQRDDGLRHRSISNLFSQQQEAE